MMMKLPAYELQKALYYVQARLLSDNGDENIYRS